MKTIDSHFIDWEANVHGYGYGTGEEHTLGALKTFMAATPESGCYDFKELEKAVTPAVAWLLIGDLCRCDMIEYGTSPRFAWLTKQGKALKGYLGSHSLEELLEVMNYDEEYIHCFPDYCNCETDCRPSNPFWSNGAYVG